MTKHFSSPEELDALLSEARPIDRSRWSKTSTTSDAPSDDPAPTYIPFPTGSLPEPVRGYVETSAQAIGCDPAYVALPLLSALAAAIGNSRTVQLKSGWQEPSIVWTMIVGESGSTKSPALDAALWFTRERQKRLWLEHAEARRAHADANREGEPPKPERILANDLTVEALAALLPDNPRGLLVARDEIAGWIGSFDRYSRGSSDSANWLEVFGARALTVDRKTTSPIYVPRATVSITGSIQPGVLKRVLGAQHRESGLVARLLFAMPPRIPKRWTDAEPDETATGLLSLTFDRLYLLLGEKTPEGDERPKALSLSDRAKARWIAFYNEHGEESAYLVGSLAATWSKLEGYAARLALVIHCVRAASGDAELRDLDRIDAESVESAVSLVRWFGQEAERIHDLLDADDPIANGDDVIGWIRRQGGAASARELSRGPRRFRKKPEEAQRALDALASTGLGKWIDCPPGPKGGAPTRRLQLVDR